MHSGEDYLRLLVQEMITRGSPVSDVVQTALAQPQYSERSHQQAVQRLMMAILADSLRSYFGPLENEAKDAERWFFSKSKKIKPFSFLAVCSSLGIEQKAAQKALSALRRESESATRPARSKKNK